MAALEHLKRFLELYDLTRQDYAIMSPLMQWIDVDSKVVKTVDMELKLTSWDLLYHICRANFDGVQSDYRQPPEEAASVGRAIYNYGHVVENVRYANDKVSVTYSDKDGSGKDIVADMVIVADGASSTIRSILVPDVERTYVGYVAWRGIVLEEEAPAHSREVFKENLTYFQGDGSHILLSVPTTLESVTLIQGY